MPNPFAEFPLEDLEPILRAYRDILPYAEQLLPLDDATDTWACAIHTTLHYFGGFEADATDPKTPKAVKTLNAVYRAALDELEVPPILYQLRYFPQKFFDLERAATTIAAPTQQTESPHQALCFYQSSVEPLEIVVLHDATYFVRGEAQDSLHLNAYTEIGLPPEVDAALMAALEEEGDLLSLGLIVARRTGLRIGELCRLEVGCLTENPDGRFSLRVPLGKLHSEREVPVDDRTAALIKTIRAQRADRPTVRDPHTGRSVALLICGLKGRVMDQALLRKRLKQVARECGIDQRVYPHRLRHTYATELLRYGVSFPGVMKLLGHRNLKMTLRYVEITNVDLGRDYLRASEKAGRHYAALDMPRSEVLAAASDPLQSIEAIFDQLLARLQTVRFDQPDRARRKKLQRYVERLRRAQKGLPDLRDRVLQLLD